MTDTITLPRDIAVDLRNATKSRIRGHGPIASQADITALDALDAALKEPEQKPATMPTQYGWLCPACGRGNAPLAQTCPCKGWPTMQITCGPATMTGGA
jgi:hypothetical protein